MTSTPTSQAKMEPAGGLPTRPATPVPYLPEADALVERVEPDRLPPGDWPPLGSVPVSVLIPVKNEQRNIVECIRHVRWAQHIVVVDSRSEDDTVALAQAMGAAVVQFDYKRHSPTGWPKKRNWTLEHYDWPHEWVLIMDADEHMTPEITREVAQVVNGTYQPAHADWAGCGDGYWLNRRFMFLGSWIRHCGYYPSYNVRLFKHRAGRYERLGNLGDTGSGDNEVHEHIVLSTGKPGTLQHDFLHYAYPDLTTWIEKHNRYSSWEAHAMLAGNESDLSASPFGPPIERRRWLKKVAHKLPCRPTLRFFYGYVLKLGFLDGYPGFVLCRLMAWYEFVSIAKWREMKRADEVGDQ